MRTGRTLERYLASEPSVAGAIHRAHPTCVKRRSTVRLAGAGPPGRDCLWVSVDNLHSLNTRNKIVPDLLYRSVRIADHHYDGHGFGIAAGADAGYRCEAPAQVSGDIEIGPFDLGKMLTLCLAVGEVHASLPRRRLHSTLLQ
jgi:hypothetical protein